uniref:Tetratricopeptide repeat-containing protein n=1 Tax=Candidatus Kentrum sp. TUN TaxID=2126343 RepID=A0A451A4R8_9GAMM|nr:MAG: Tetratricopeptide repeat-containing protein [Candidatus Kentron sp. TUN]
MEDSQDPEISQRALYDLAIAKSRRSGSGNASEEFRHDLQRLIEEYPNGSLFDDALYQLAMAYFQDGDMDKALAAFQLLREFDEENGWAKNNWVEIAHLRPALIHYSRGDSADLGKAVVLLERLVTDIPDGDLTAAGHFWAGRISEELNQRNRARKHFRHLIENNSLHHYGLRARLHLQYGAKAKTMHHMDAKIRQQIAQEIAAGRLTHIPKPISPFSGPYHRRLESTLTSGLYKAVLETRDRFRKFFPSRELKQIGMRKLDEIHAVPLMSMLSSLRQLADAAKDSATDNRNRLEIAYAVGRYANDWELAMAMVFAIGEPEGVIERAAIMREPGYLSTAYPIRYRENILEHSRKYNIPPHLAYAVMRHKSYFYPAALSPEGALGLFQLMPETFDSLDRDWALLGESGMPSREAFLVNSDLSIGLWMRWFGERVLPRQKGDLFFAVLDDQVGADNLKKWRKSWPKEIENDFELMLESVRSAETRRFLRDVLASWEVAEIICLFPTRFCE